MRVVRLLVPSATVVGRLLDAAEAVDGARAVSEHAELALRAAPGSPGASAHVVHLGVLGDGDLVAYAQVEGAPGGAVVVEGVVHPDHRRGGIGAAVREAVLAEAAGRPLLAWAHGDHAGAAALAARPAPGPPARRTRELLQMRRPLQAGCDVPVAELPQVTLPPGVRLRAFVPGADDDAWLAVNARAFATHPEQGAWTRGDLVARMAEPWFDPAGFLLAEDHAENTGPGRLLGFHWTKVHAPTPDTGAIGEVYVVGVDPAAQGRRLGAALTLAGLHHLRERGLPAVLLYVEHDNSRALRVYRALGFEVVRVDVQYSLP